ncbi:EthD family reductase [Poseidonibacter ostreae]|jgi:uncharacterized protein (TIGR02118 family)|uniref:EthD family reductase n=1 Tax=Poseidonibacter ostreae TaxID=2654171 RepID=A0A6L4WS84_9BACT|nr:EthD family reductase [Poseidonibacter ostreae]KAB7885501.1 EthD family reductase [Poseidonibacter ostreae]KAB7888520.1 EthD family reductase [Poseidonibacter ostreae]KAB7890713.1 EthD family reductase [Poseidonibacter ostreae]
MIKVSVMYPNSEDVVFDKEYYCNKHVPLVSKLLGDALKNAQVDFGLAGGVPGTPALYVVITQMTFDSIEAFQSIFAVHAEEILSDIPNFTNSQPQIQISEIII